MDFRFVSVNVTPAKFANLLGTGCRLIQQDKQYLIPQALGTVQHELNFLLGQQAICLMAYLVTIWAPRSWIRIDQSTARGYTDRHRQFAKPGVVAAVNQESFAGGRSESPSAELRTTAAG